MSRQLDLSLELRLRQSLTALLPSLWMQVILLGGLMTGLRVWKTRCTVLLVDEEKEDHPHDGDLSRLFRAVHSAGGFA